MKATTLRDFLLGKTSALRLAGEATIAIENSGSTTRRVRFQDLDSEKQFTITAPMLVRLCDVVLTGELPASALEPIGFSVIASDYFQWAEDDDLVARVIYDWASPEINWELTPESVRMFRGWLTGEVTPPPVPQTNPAAGPGRLLSRTVWVRPPKGAQAGDEA